MRSPHSSTQSLAFSKGRLLLCDIIIIAIIGRLTEKFQIFRIRNECANFSNESVIFVILIHIIG